MLLKRIQNSVQNVYIVTHDSCEICIYMKFLYVKSTCLCTQFVDSIKLSEFKIVYESVHMNESDA